MLQFYYIKKLLIIILLFQGVSAVLGGLALIISNGSGMPVAWLSNSTFSSYLIPGLILLFVIGGTSLIAAYYLLKKHKHQFEASAIAGFGILIWIFVKISIIRQSSFLQILYFASGITILTLVMLLLKKSTK